MISLDQIRLLEGKITRALDLVRTLREENATLRQGLASAQKRMRELETMVDGLKTDQKEIESIIVRTLHNLDDLEETAATAGGIPAATAGGIPAATAGGIPAATAGGIPAATAGGIPAATAGGIPAATAGGIPAATAGGIPAATAGGIPAVTANSPAPAGTGPSPAPGGAPSSRRERASAPAGQKEPAAAPPVAATPPENDTGVGPATEELDIF